MRPAYAPAPVEVPVEAPVRPDDGAMAGPRWDAVLEIDFRVGAQRFYHMTGWSDPEWTAGRQFRIALGQIPRRDRLMLRLTATPYMAQAFTVAVNDSEAGSHAAEAPFTATFVVPDEAVRADRSLVVTIDLADPKRPCDLSGSADDRALGLMIHRIEVLGTDGAIEDCWPALAGITHDSDADILGRFESLGDNCEFGFVQKRQGVGGSTLLRFCATPVQRLLDGLAHGFVAIDDPAGLTLVENGPDAAREYQIVSNRYGLHYHTLTFTHEAAAEDVRRREISKLGHKHRKFLDGLSRRDRIYVLKQNAPLSLATVWTVWLALQRFGPNTLLWVRLPHGDEAAGEVRVVGPGLMEAVVPVFADYTDATRGDDRGWIVLCRRALRLAESQVGRHVRGSRDTGHADR